MRGDGQQGRRTAASALAAGAFVVFTFLSPVMAEESDPAARWVSVFGWMQTGERLAAANQWPLALGSYIESHRQISELAAKHPEFEPELIAYRSGKLESTISEAEARLTSDEHAIMMKYLDFIESLELGQAQRFRNEFEASLSTLDMAKSLLDDIIARKPAEFREAVDSQYQRLVSSIEWLNAQIDFKERSRRASYAKTGDDRGTTQFIKESDLPRSEEGIEASGILFPMSLASLEPAEEPPGDEEIEADLPEVTDESVPDAVKIDDKASLPAMNFRMSSKRQMQEAPGAPGNATEVAP